MAKSNFRTSNVIDFQAAKAARQVRPVQARKAAAVGRSTGDLARSLKRDAVRQAARAAL